ncbi:MAG: hypothetical protein RL750_835 [Bacteroidota bacterium]
MIFRSLRFSSLLIASTLLSAGIFAQGLTGVWRGYFITDQFEQYKFEIQIEQSGPTVQGVSYSYLNTVFYGKAALNGSFESTGKRLRLQETKTIELKMSDGSHSCIMGCDLVLVRSGKEEFLEGTYSSQFEKSAPGIRKGADCGDGKVYLRRVTDSDFYLEPFLKNQTRTNKPIFDNQAPPDRNKPNQAVVKKDTPKSNPIQKLFIERSNPSSLTQESNPSQTIAERNRPTNPIPTPQALKDRENVLARELVVTDRNIRIRLFDNGEIDGDTISVYLGKQLALSEKRLTANALELTISIPEETNEQEITLVAENLGRIPPNTSLMIVESGGDRFEVRITSTEQKNAVVRFRYKPY